MIGEIMVLVQVRPLARSKISLVRQRGLAMVEFSLVAGVLVLLGFIAVDIGRGFFLRNTMHKAAQNTARYIAKNGCLEGLTDSGIQGLFFGMTQSKLFEKQPSMNITYGPAPGQIDASAVTCSADDKGYASCCEMFPYVKVFSSTSYHWYSSGVLAFMGFSSIGTPQGVSAFSSQRIGLTTEGP